MATKIGWLIYGVGDDVILVRGEDPYTELIRPLEPIPEGSILIGGLWTDKAAAEQECHLLHRLRNVRTSVSEDEREFSRRGF